MNRRIKRARKRRATGHPDHNTAFRAYLRRFPRAVRREFLADPRKRLLSWTASKIGKENSFTRSLIDKRAKLVVRFEDGTPDMPWLMPGMKWQAWEQGVQDE